MSGRRGMALGAHVRCFRQTSGFLQLGYDPAIGALQPDFKRDLGLPAQNVAQACVIAVATAYALGLARVVAFADALAGDGGDEVYQLVDGHQAVAAQIERMRVIGEHKTVDALHAIIDVEERAGLVAIAPDFDFVAVVCQRDFAAQGCRGFFPPAFVFAQGTVDVVEAGNTDLHAVIFRVVLAELFREELFPAVSLFGVRRVGVLFPQWGDLGDALAILRIDAGRGREKEALHAVEPAGFEHVGVDKDVVASNIGVVVANVADASHIGGKVVNVLHAFRGAQAVFPAAQVQQEEFVSSSGLVGRGFNVGASDPIVMLDEEANQMVPDEPSGAGDQDACGHLPLRRSGTAGAMTYEAAKLVAAERSALEGSKFACVSQCAAVWRASR